MFYDIKALELCAIAAHEANNKYCERIGDATMPDWARCPPWYKASMFTGVREAIGGNTPEKSHECWLRCKEADGWVYGETKDITKKTHPCMRPWDELLAEQQMKSVIFCTAVATMLGFVKNRACHRMLANCEEGAVAMAETIGSMAEDSVSAIVEVSGIRKKARSRYEQ